MRNRVMYFGVLLGLLLTLNVSADIKCDSGKPGDTVNCVLSNVDASGNTSNIATDNGLKFVSCDICESDGSYSLSPGKNGNFKFLISDTIKENKTLGVTIAGNSGKVTVNVGTTTTTAASSEVVYTVTLVPGNGKSNKTQTCKVNSLNSTCDVTLEDLDDPNFMGWGTQKNCTNGSKGNIKVNKDITYYACYKSDEQTTTKASNSNLLLKSLILKNGEDVLKIDFSMRVKEYDVTVSKDVEKLTVEAVAQDSEATVTVSGNEELKDGKNKISILITAKDGSTNEYVININKTDKVAAPLLANLVIGGGYNIDFDPEKFVYSVTIDKNINQLILKYDVENEDDEVTVIGNENLKNGSVIKVVVKAADGDETSTYNINIVKSSDNLMIYIIAGISLLVILIILLIVVIKKGKGKKTDKKDNFQGNVKKKSTTPNIPNVSSVTNNVAKPVVNEKKDDFEVLDF